MRPVGWELIFSLLNTVQLLHRHRWMKEKQAPGHSHVKGPSPLLQRAQRGRGDMDILFSFSLCHLHQFHYAHLSVWLHIVGVWGSFSCWTYVWITKKELFLNYTSPFHLLSSWTNALTQTHIIHTIAFIIAVIYIYIYFPYMQRIFWSENVLLVLT